MKKSILLFASILVCASVSCSKPTEQNAKLPTAKSCQGGASALTLSGLCINEAEQLLQMAQTSKEQYPALMDGCQWSVNEAPFITGDVLLYQAASCNGNTAKLAFNPQTDRADIFIETSAIGGIKGAQSPVGSLFTVDPGDPDLSLETWARTEMERGGVDADYAVRCKTRPSPEDGLDAFVVDITPRPAPSTSEPRSDCGQYGYNEESHAYWRIAYDFGWFFDLGQDAYQDFAPNSLTLVTKTKTGEWVPAKTLMNSNSVLPNADPLNDYVLRNIAEELGVVEVDYGNIGDWLIIEGTLSGKTAYCVAEKQFDQTKLRVGTDGGQWQIGVPYPSSADHYGRLEVDGREQGFTGTSTKNWTIGWVGLPIVDALKEGKMLILDIKKASLDYSLVGIDEAITMVETCIAG